MYHSMMKMKNLKGANAAPKVHRITTIETAPFDDQKPGTSGLRKKTLVFQKKNYTANFIQATLNALREYKSKNGGDTNIERLVVGGDGREYTQKAIDIIFKICLANKIPRLLVACEGIMSTPAASHTIRSEGLDGGFVLTASHNPGGIKGDFGIKFNDSNGAPAPEELTELIYEHSKRIESYEYTSIPKKPKFDTSLFIEDDDVLDIESEKAVIYLGKRDEDEEKNQIEVVIFDPVKKYLEMTEKLFDLDLIAKMFERGLTGAVDSMHGVMGPFVCSILCTRLKMPGGGHLHNNPRPDFGGLHPDPNLVYAEQLVETLKTNPSLKFGIAFDGDGDRNMVLGEGGFFVTPSDALAVIAANSKYIKAFWSTKTFDEQTTNSTIRGVARSMPTAPAVDRFAKKHNLPVYETPTGWKYFCNLFEDKRISICGEESFGLGSDHIREKDGLWACLAWLSIMASTNKSIKQLVEDHWNEYGRDYFTRYDYENVSSELATEYFKAVESLIESKDLIGKKLGRSEEYEIVTADSWSYTDPVTGRTTANQGYRLVMANGARVVIRMSGTGSSGATIRLYFNDYSETDLKSEPGEFMEGLIDSTLKLTNIASMINCEKPTVIT